MKKNKSVRFFTTYWKFNQKEFDQNSLISFPEETVFSLECNKCHYFQTGSEQVEWVVPFQIPCSYHSLVRACRKTMLEIRIKKLSCKENIGSVK